MVAPRSMVQEPSSQRGHCRQHPRDNRPERSQEEEIQPCETKKAWSPNIDKGPPVEEPEWKHQKKQAKKGAKPFYVERRYTGPARQFLPWLEKQREWHVDRRFKTAKARDQCLRNLEHKRTSQNSYHFYTNYEYRGGEDLT